MRCNILKELKQCFSKPPIQHSPARLVFQPSNVEAFVSVLEENSGKKPEKNSTVRPKGRLMNP